MTRVVLASGNAGKLRELAVLLAPFSLQLEAQGDFGIHPAAETGTTFVENALLKAHHAARHARLPALADDSGLEVDALKGAPGVRSARYAADAHNAPDDSGNSNDEANNARLLRELHDVPEEFRTGRFVCVIAVARNGHTLATFHGQAEGILLHAPRGSNGFGYDPLFFFPQIEKTFAELTAEEKAKYSHRGAAFRQFLEWADHWSDLHPHSAR